MSAKKGHSSEVIIRNLRQAEVMLHEGKTIVEIVDLSVFLIRPITNGVRNMEGCKFLKLNASRSLSGKIAALKKRLLTLQ